MDRRLSWSVRIVIVVECGIVVDVRSVRSRRKAGLFMMHSLNNKSAQTPLQDLLIQSNKLSLYLVPLLLRKNTNESDHD